MPKEEKAQLQQTTAPGLMHSPTTTFFESQAWSNSQEAAEQAAAEKAAAEEKKGSGLIIRTLTGHNFPVEYDESDTIAVVKNKIQAKEGIAADDQRLIFDKKQLSNNATLSSLGIKSGDTIHLILRLRGGILGGGRRRKTRRKRKRKTRRKTRRKTKRKRKRKKRKRKTRKRMCKFRK